MSGRTRALFALVALTAACRSTAPCKPGTLLLAVELGGAGTEAARVYVRVRGADDRLLSSGEVVRPAGQPDGTIEVRFASGYPAGEMVAILVEARRGDETLARGSMSTRLADGCAALTLSLASTDAGADLPDGAAPDRSEDAAPDAEPAPADAAPTVDGGPNVDAGSTGDTAPPPPDASPEAASPDTTPDTAPPADAPVSVNARRVFVTSSRHTGNLGGLAGANGICQRLADSAELGGTYKAWLGAGLNGPAGSMVYSTVPYVLVNGQRVADHWNDLVDGSLRHEIDRDERGQEIRPLPFACQGGEVWSNVTPSGNVQGALNDCFGWTSTSGTSNTGQLERNDQRWTQGDCSNTSCLRDLPFYCFEQ